jgi:hypothetical protein
VGLCDAKEDSNNETNRGPGCADQEDAAIPGTIGQEPGQRTGQAVSKILKSSEGAKCRAVPRRGLVNAG